MTEQNNPKTIQGAALAGAVLLYSASKSDDMLKSAIHHFVKDTEKAYGVTISCVDSDKEALTENGKSVIVVGGCDEASLAMEQALTGKSYRVVVEEQGSIYRITLVGTNGINTMRALQYLYANSVKDGKMTIPTQMDIVIDTLYVRDPCIVLHDGKYYLYCGRESGFGVRVSEDLLHWSEETVIFDHNEAEGFDGYRDYWAPECHYYKGKFYLFATYRSSLNEHRGSAIFRCDTPDGRFELITKSAHTKTGRGHLTPFDWDTIDGTLYVDENGKPWMVFVYEWTSTEDGIGRMAYAPLSEDLTHFTEEPKMMFKANDAPWSNRQVTDGCWLYRCEDGTLLMIWSNMADGKGIGNGYTVGLARSSNGRLDGEWEQLEIPLFNQNDRNIYCTIEGGHGMIFRDYDGRLYLSIHAPNRGEHIAATRIPLIEQDGMLRLDLVQ